MAPQLVDGDHLLFDPRAYQQQAPKIGHIIVARHPFHSRVQIVKQVLAIDAAKRFIVGADPQNPWGTVSQSAVFGRVTLRVGESTEVLSA